MVSISSKCLRWHFKVTEPAPSALRTPKLGHQCQMHWDSSLCTSPSVPFKTSLSHPLHRNSTVLNSKVISVTVKPFPRSFLTPLEIEFSHLYNVSLSWEPAWSFSCIRFFIAGVCWCKEGGFYWASETSLLMQDPQFPLTKAVEALDCYHEIKLVLVSCQLPRMTWPKWEEGTTLLAQGTWAEFSQIHAISPWAWSWEKNCALINKWTITIEKGKREREGCFP